jgi:hypothetical protein
MGPAKSGAAAVAAIETESLSLGSELNVQALPGGPYLR